MLFAEKWIAWLLCLCCWPVSPCRNADWREPSLPKRVPSMELSRIMCRASSTTSPARRQCPANTTTANWPTTWSNWPTKQWQGRPTLSRANARGTLSWSTLCWDCPRIWMTREGSEAKETNTCNLYLTNPALLSVLQCAIRLALRNDKLNK